VLEDNQVKRIRVNSAGLFLPSVRLGSVVQEGDEIGVVMDPKTSTSVETIHSTSTGIVIALRNQPVVSLGELVARIQSMEQE
jgi:predicted deacylase